MQQVLQSLKTGETHIRDIACPQTGPHEVLIATQKSLISSGTERMLVNFGKASLLSKAKQQPDKVKQVLDKVKTDGFKPTLDAVLTKLDEEIPMGYSNAGIVIDVGERVSQFKKGDRVLSNGPHAQIVCVGENLVTHIPDDVPDEQACFAVLGAIAINGCRLAQPTLGERFVVIGLGLLGLLTARILQAQGCQVIGIDVDPSKIAFARACGMTAFHHGKDETLETDIAGIDQRAGVDGVIITASTDNAEPIRQAARLSRENGRIILIGVAKCELDRDIFYDKSLTFRVARAYGPGRYDPQYELKGIDYPLAHVRWTASRNMQAFLQCLSSGAIQVHDLISNTLDFNQSADAYKNLLHDNTLYGVVLNYPTIAEKDNLITHTQQHYSREQQLTGIQPNKAVVGIIGAGQYTKRILLPILRKQKQPIHMIISKGGLTGASCARKFNIIKSATQLTHLLEDATINTAIITTRHDTHADLTLQCLAAQKHIFVEKPLCISHQQLDAIQVAHREHPKQLLMVGFNRRFSPLVVQIKKLLESVNTAKNIVMTINAGHLPAEHWNNDASIGGGRLLGEACHFIDLARFLVGMPISQYSVHSTVPARQDNNTFHIILTFIDGSTASIHYITNGHRAFPKETVQVFTAGKVLVCDNYRKLKGYGWKNFNCKTVWSQDKGHAACMKAFLDAIHSGKPSPIASEEIFEVMHATLCLADSLHTKVTG